MRELPMQRSLQGGGWQKLLPAPLPVQVPPAVPVLVVHA
jgi:hypothetical protein